MTRQVMYLYLVGGLPAGRIARITSESRAAIRSHLKEGGISMRLISGYFRGRDVVCDSVTKAGYRSFHGYAQVNSLAPISEQASALGVTEKSLTKVYNAYQKLLVRLRSAGIVLPTSQMSGADVERPAEDRAS